VISSARTRRHRPAVPLRRLLLASAAALLPVLAGCEAGNQAPTLEFHVPTDAQTASAGSLLIRNVFVLGAPLGEKLQPGGTASLFFSVLTTSGSDRLVSISAPGSAASVTLPGGGLNVTTSRPVLLNGPQTKAFLVGLTRKITSGSAITIVLHFQQAGAVTLKGVPVMARAAHYVTYGPAPSPTASTAATTAHRKHHATVTLSPTPTPTAS
jgi:copper(I)-binding protein